MSDRSRYFLDTEFIDDGLTIELISIAIVADDGREYYAVSTDADHGAANEWVAANVIPHLPPRTHEAWRSRKTIGKDLVQFFRAGKTPEMWAWYSAYDYVAFCQLFGPRVLLPLGLPTICHELKQLTNQRGNPPLPKQTSIAHDALNDARWNKQVFEYLTK